MIKDIERAYGILIDRHYQEELFSDLNGFEEAGDAWHAFCPFHDDAMQTLLVYADRPEYFCFACSTRGDWIDYLMKSRGIGFNEALKILSSASGLKIKCSETQWRRDLRLGLLYESALSFFKAQLWNGSTGYEYLHQRGYTNEEIEAMGIGFSSSKEAVEEYLLSEGFELSEIRGAMKTELLPEFSLIIPWRDTCGRLEGLIGRKTSGSGKDAYTPLSDIEVMNTAPFMMYKSRGKKELVITQGYFDTLLANLVGVNAVGIGDSGLDEEQIEALAGYGVSRFVLCLKTDEARNRACELFKAKALEAVILELPEQCYGADDYIRASCIHKFAALVGQAIKSSQPK